MKTFLSCYHFSRRLSSQQTFKAALQTKLEPRPKIKEAVSEKSDEIKQMQDEFKGAKSMKMLDKIIDDCFKKGYTMDKILAEAQKGKLLNDSIKQAFVEDAQKSKVVSEKQKQFQNIFNDSFSQTVNDQTKESNTTSTQSSQIHKQQNSSHKSKQGNQSSKNGAPAVDPNKKSKDQLKGEEQNQKQDKKNNKNQKGKK